jgi:hypothetical protein
MGGPPVASGWHRKDPNSPATIARVREYNSPQYKAARLAVKAQVDAGLAHCWRPNCGRLLKPGHWHLGHDDHDRTIIRGGECATCNLKAAAAKGARVANAKRRVGVTALPM